MDIQSKLSALAIQKIEQVVQQTIPTVTEIALQTGIKNLGLDNVEMPNFCLPQENIESILKIRNNIINKLNDASKLIELLSNTTDSLTPLVTIAENSLNIGKTAIIGLETVLLLTPPAVPIPGPIITNYVKANKLVNITIPPIITSVTNKINSIATAISYVNNILSNIINILKSIDQYLIGCGALKSNLIPYSNYINNINLQYSNIQNTTPTIYKGFNLEIVEEPYSATVNRRKAVAKNKNGIILISTPLSFTTNNQALLNSLALLIDSNNLRAD